MTRDEVLSYCLAKPGAWTDEPWEGDTVAKVGSKVFAFIGGPGSRSVGVKCGAYSTIVATLPKRERP